MDIQGILYSFALGLVGALFSGIFVYLWQNCRHTKDHVNKKQACKMFCFYILFYCVLVGLLVCLATLVLGFQNNPPTSSNPSCSCQNITYIENYYNISNINIENKKSAFSVEELKYLIQKNPREP